MIRDEERQCLTEKNTLCNVTCSLSRASKNHALGVTGQKKPTGPVSTCERVLPRPGTQLAKATTANVRKSKTCLSINDLASLQFPMANEKIQIKRSAARIGEAQNYVHGHVKQTPDPKTISAVLQGSKKNLQKIGGGLLQYNKETPQKHYKKTPRRRQTASTSKMARMETAKGTKKKANSEKALGNHPPKRDLIANISLVFVYLPVTPRRTVQFLVLRTTNDSLPAGDKTNASARHISHTLIMIKMNPTTMSSRTVYDKLLTATPQT